MASQSISFTDKGLIKPKVKLFLLCLLSVILMITDHHYVLTKQIRSQLMTFIYPIQWLAKKPIDATFNTIYFFSKRQDLIVQNNFLLKENEILAAQIKNQQQLELEIAELKSLQNLSTNTFDFITSAEIISIQHNQINGKYIINKGSQDGIQLGQAVVNNHGLIGQVTQLGRFSAEVSTILYEKSVIPVMVARTGFRSLIYGDADSLNLRYFPSTENLSVNDILVTSGLDDNFPAGIPVAKITRIEKVIGAPYYKTNTAALANINQTRYVLVLPLRNPNIDISNEADRNE